MKFNKIAGSVVGLLMYSTVSHAGTLSAYQNFYISYMSPADVITAVTYAQSQGITQFSMWSVDEDASPSSEDSLLDAMNGWDPEAVIATYFPDSAVYNDQKAIPGLPYTIKGSAYDLDPKLAASNTLTYAFSQTQVPSSPGQGDAYLNTPNSYGAIYFYDPWSDLKAGDAFCGKSNLPTGVPVDGNGYNLICGYAIDNQAQYYNQYQNNGAFNHYGNFEAFAALPASIQGKTGQPIVTTLAIGGRGHNSSFEAIFDPAAYGANITAAEATANFVHSVVTVMNAYGIEGVELDYEDPAMTPLQSQEYLQLIEALNAALAANQFMSLSILANPAYIARFAPHVLQDIASLSQVKVMNALTYDFSGAFSYGGSTNPGTTGFLSNVYPPNDQNTPAGYDSSIQNTVDAMLQAGVPANKIGIGIPAFGRALASLPGPAGANHYLFSPLDPNVVIPAGDRDPAHCTQNIANWQSADSCQGLFSYRYIMRHIVFSGVPETDHIDDSGNLYNGTTAFGPTWTVP